MEEGEALSFLSGRRFRHDLRSSAISPLSIRVSIRVSIIFPIFWV